MRIAIIQISEAGSRVVSFLQQELNAQCIARTDVGSRWHDFDAFVFIGAMGICVRTIAPYVEDKHSDPAIVCVDSFGKNVISVLSGHIGGANDLTRQIASILGVEPIITTQSDNAGLWALDTLGERFDWTIVDGNSMNDCIFAFVNKDPTALLLEARDEGTDYLERTLPDHVTLIHDISEAGLSKFKLLIIVSPFIRIIPKGLLSLHFVPKVATVGFGLAHHPDDYKSILDQMNAAFAEQGVLPCFRRYCTIDVKADEPFCALLEERHSEDVIFFTAEQLAAIDVPNPSDTVQKHVGTPSVCEAAAILGSDHGHLMIPKIKGKNWTAALAIDKVHYRPTPALPVREGAVTTTNNKADACSVHSTPLPYREGQGGGSVEIVGAGPGDPDLISVRGRSFLERADLILYAGSLVPKALTECHKPGAVVRSSADMTLEEQCALMKEHYDRAHLIVRLHTGDPCIFGAIQEQMAFFDAHGMNYHITPGISSFLAAAAELRSQFTIPERTQTIILTRGEGRTPMPEKEQLHLLAKSQSTMCIFLSAAIVDDVQRELLTEYPENTPVAACYHLTWPDQKIYRGVLKDLAKIVHDNHLTLTTMLVVGEAIDNRQGLSALYDKHFTHLFREGKT